MLIAAAGALLGEWAGLIDPAVLRETDQVDFIYDVGAFSFIVALLAGAAGMLALTSAKSAALVGVVHLGHHGARGGVRGGGGHCRGMGDGCAVRSAAAGEPGRRCVRRDACTSAAYAP